MATISPGRGPPGRAPPPPQQPQQPTAPSETSNPPPRPTPGVAALPAIPDEERAELPLGASASVLLTALPRDAAGALANANRPDESKVTVRFKHIGSAPILKRTLFKISSSARFDKITAFLRKQLNLPLEESLFLYVNSSFAPSGDEEVGNLFRCFKVDEQLIVNYCRSVAFG